MRGPDGYGGPVVHWWRDSLLYCGAGLDWRYEGIVGGYLTLFERTGEPRWLEKARRAGDDLVRGQCPDGHYRGSRFEANPGPGGTPHEAAADVALLLLAGALRRQGDESWLAYRDSVERNLRRYYLDRLWCGAERWFRDHPLRRSFVPNKAATLVEALCLLADLTAREEYLERYVRPTADAILAHQIRTPGSRLDGAIAQNTLGGTVVEKYFPYYVARCVPGLVEAYERLGDERHLNAALAAASFVLRWREPDGGVPQVVYATGRVNRYPRWVAGTGDVLRGFDRLRPYGCNADLEPTLGRLLAGQLPTGAFRTADGFASQASQRQPGALPDACDLLPVAGWNDKAFRYLTGLVDGVPDVFEVTATELACTWRGRPGVFREDDVTVSVEVGGIMQYRWRKGETWARVSSSP